jgi:hypothetical protein
MKLFYNSAGEVSADFIYKVIPNRAAISAVLNNKPFGEALGMGDLMAVWERAYGPVKKVAVAAETAGTGTAAAAVKGGPNAGAKPAAAGAGEGGEAKK